MDVTCERCSTAYEFDDALVSERGTTVKCTNCGHQFKVRRAEPVGAPERWLVRTIDGRELEFRALRELQAAIAQALISRDDVLSRGGSRPRRLGSIAELEPFFAAAMSTASAHSTSPGIGPRGAPRGRIPTPQGLGAVSLPGAPQRTEGSVAIPLPIGPRMADADSVDDTMVMPPALSPRRPPSAPPPPMRRSVPPAPLPPPAPPGVVVLPAGAPALPEPEPRRQERARPFPFDEASLATPMPPPVAPARPPPPAPPPPAAEARHEEPVSAEPSPRPAPSYVPASAAGSSSPGHTPPPPSSPLYTPTPSAARVSMMNDEGYAEPRFSSIAPTRRTGAARWIVGFVVGGMVALALATVGRKLLLPGPTTQATSAGDERIGALLQEGEKSLADGDLEAAKEQFDKASVLGEKSPRVAADLARLAAVKADVAWLRARILDEGDPDQPEAKRELEKAAERSAKAAERAATIAPTDPAVVRSRIDALRVSGKLDDARKLVGAIAGGGSQPDNALTLAALDLAEAAPPFPTVIERLRTALGADQNLGRARAMLVYALARSGDAAGAKSEIDRLAALPRPHPLVRQLKAFVARSDKPAPEGSASADASPSAKASAKASAVAVTPPPRERPAQEPREPAQPHQPPPPGGHVDTSDLPGIKPPPNAGSPPPPPPAPAGTIPPGVDTSDLPGFK